MSDTSSHETRLAELLDTIRARPDQPWSAGRLQKVRRQSGGPTQRGTARRDLAALARRGHLTAHGPDDGRFYTLNPTKDGAS